MGDEPVAAREVENLLTDLLHGQKAHPAALPYLRAQALEEIVSRRLVLAYARRNGESPRAAELERAMKDFKARLTAQRKSLDGLLKSQSLSEADLRRQLAWDLLWAKYLARYLTTERQEYYFRTHRRELDGTEMAVSHILLRPSANAGPRAMDDLARQAEAIRSEIAAGKTTFAEAARRYSAGPSGQEGGRLGWIGRRGPMEEAFSRAAFALEVGQVSGPVRSLFGVHLIRCDEIKPGRKQLAEARKEVEEGLSRELLEKLARIERRYTPVKYSAALPRFKPGTRELDDR